MPNSKKYRNICVTCFNELKKTRDDILQNDLVKYAVGQEEICPETKKHHLQLYIELSGQYSLKTIQDKIFNGEKVHVESRKGSQDDAINYCLKLETRDPEGLALKKGIKSQQGKRSDLDGMVDMIENNHTAKEILMEYRGNGMRHISHIIQCLKVFHGCEAIDNFILGCRNNGEISNPYEELLENELIDELSKSVSEVAGNTETATSETTSKNLKKSSQTHKIIKLERLTRKTEKVLAKAEPVAL